MNYSKFVLLTALLLPEAALASQMSSTNYASNAGQIVSGGSTAAKDAPSVLKSGSSAAASNLFASTKADSLGQGAFLPSSGSSSPAYAAKPATLPEIASIAPCGASSGDINCDGVVDVADALLALKAGAGLSHLSSAEISRGDVGPLLNGATVQDGRIDIEDAMLILRKSVGLNF